jgi:hypothetical protein
MIANFRPHVSITTPHEIVLKTLAIRPAFMRDLAEPTGLTEDTLARSIATLIVEGKLTWSPRGLVVAGAA